MVSAQIRTAIVLSLSFILVAQVAFLPLPLSMIFAVIILCLWLSLKKGKPLAKVWTFLLTFAALVTIYFSYKSFLGVDAGVAALSTFLFAKALESKNKRDLVILFNFALFVSASSFLFSQAFWMAILVILCLMSCLIGLYRIQSGEFDVDISSQSQALKQDAQHVAKFVAYALPFFVLLFVFFPRLPPLWHIPIPANKAVTGISDSMSPGDIAELSQSSALAFRIIGNVTKLPPRHELYWRALVLDEYDGQKWTSSFFNQQPLAPQQVAQQPNHQNWDYQYLAADPSILWVMGLEKSVPLERRYYNRQDWGIVPHRLRQRIEPIPLRWIGQSIQTDGQHLDFLHRLNTRTQNTLDLQAQQLAQQLFVQSGQDEKRYIQQVLNWYRTNNFVYTLTPGTLGQNRIDDFLFKARQGFCEHYASSFVMLMRYVNISARVVTGYQGGQLAPDGKSWEVRQLDAHAWTEVFLDGQWQRIDPTAIIAPQRIDDGMQNLIAQDDRVFGERSRWISQNFAMMTKLRIWSDYATYQWQSKVVGYNADSQRSWLNKLGLHSSYSLVILLIASVLSLIAIYFSWMKWSSRKAIPSLERALMQFNTSLQDDLKRQEAETIKQWLKRLSLKVPETEQAYFYELIQNYERVTYANHTMTSTDLKHFKKLLKSCALVLKSQ